MAAICHFVGRLREDKRFLNDPRTFYFKIATCFLWGPD